MWKVMKEIVGYVKIKQDNFPKRLLIDSKELQTVKSYSNGNLLTLELKKK